MQRPANKNIDAASSCIFYAFVFFNCTFIYSQSTIIDSLNSAYTNLKTDSARIDMLIELGGQFYVNGNYIDALKHYETCLRISDKIKSSDGKAAAYNGFGLVHEAMGNYGEAIKMLYASLREYERNHNDYNLTSTLVNISLIYLDQQNFDEALKSNSQAQKICERTKNKYTLGYVYNVFGIIHYSRKDYIQAIKNHSEALRLRKETNDETSIPDSYTNLGIVYYDIGRELKTSDSDSSKICFELARCYYDSANTYYNKNENLAGIAAVKTNTGALFVQLKKYAEAEQLLIEAAERYRSMGSKEGLRECYQALAEVYTETSRHREAFDSYKQFILFRDSLINEDHTRKTVQHQMQYEFDKKDAEAKAAQVKKDAVEEAEKRRQSILLWSVATGLFLVLSFAVFVLKAYRQKKRSNLEIIAQKEIIEQKQMEILDSIYYARRIQKALMATEFSFRKSLSRLKQNR